MMNKVLLDWSKLNSKIKYSFTKKKFFNEYYFRLNYVVPGIRTIGYCRDPSELEFRVSNHNSNTMRWRGIQRRNSLAKFSQIKDFFQIYLDQSHPHPLKFRIEADQISIYSNSENYLYEIASVKLKQWCDDLQSISLIESDQVRRLLDCGYVLVNKPQTHPYRVKIKETFSFSAERHALLMYLKNLGEHARVTKFMLARLSGDNKYFPGGYIHVNDDRIVDMLKLVAPNLIGSVNQLVQQ